MRKFLSIVLLLVFCVSCSLDDGENYHYEFLPFESIEFPETFTLGETYTINFTFVRPTSCHAYHSVFFNSDNENRTIAVTSIVFNEDNCVVLESDNIAMQSFDFKVLYDQTYIFHVWKGEDSEGVDIYETFEVPVVTD